MRPGRNANRPVERRERGNRRRSERVVLHELEAEIVVSVPQQDQLEIQSMEQGMKDFLQDIRDVWDQDLLNES